MVQDISNAYSPPPLSFRDCLVDGRIDVARYMVYSQSLQYDEETDHLEELIRSNKTKRDNESSVFSSNKKARNIYRSIKRHRILCRADDGTLRQVTHEDSTWYRLYIETPPVGERLLKQFRKRFRLPYNDFISLCNDLKTHAFFHRWSYGDAVGVKASDIRLLLLGALRYLGRAHTFDDACEATFISADVHRVFFKAFIEYGSTVLYEKHVMSPMKTMDMSRIEKLFNFAGFNGCIGSSDGTHIGMLCCPSWAFHNHKGYKLAIPSRNYNATVAHWRQILGSTFGHPGTWNDKSLILFDDLIKNIHEGKLFANNEFKLFELDKDGNVVEITYLGVWFLVDNGYLDWSTTVPPMNNPLTFEEIRFSEWLESMRKDIECTFGIMKKRFNVLKYGIRLHKISDCDKVWATCCALHNRILNIDGLDTCWEQSTKEKGYLKFDIPFSMQRLNRHDDNEEIRPGTDYDENFFEKYSQQGKRVVRKMPLLIFQERLVHHFDIRFKRNDLAWPKRKKTERKY